jgi:hypothetical protein
MVQATIGQKTPGTNLSSAQQEVAMRPTIVNLLCLLMMLIGLRVSAAAQDFIGVVKSIEGSAVIQRSETAIPAVNGMEIQKGDIVRTDRNSSVGLVFSDDTRISMGPGTEIAVDDYLFEPLEKKLSFVLRMIQGTVSFLSGQMAKLSPESVRLVMPAATIGVRGTHVLIKVD